MKTDNKYGKHKIVWFPEKLQSFRTGEITAPIYVRVKPLNRCNHKCFWCVYHEPDLSQMHESMEKKDIISIEKMREILNDFFNMGVKAVTYSGGGEPLMHPDIKEILYLTKFYGIDLSVITNGQFLSGDIAEHLREAKWVRVSIDYANEEGFVKSRRIRGKFFQPIFDNIGDFAKIKTPECDLSVNYIITKENYEDLESAATQLVDLGVENIRFSPMWIHNFQEYHQDIKFKIIADLQKIQEKLNSDKVRIFSSYTQEVFEKDPGVRPYNKCYVKEFNPVIGADLKVYACHNRAYAEDSVITSIENQSFKEAWFGPQAKFFHDTFNCQKVCTTQCAADEKNIFINDLMSQSFDNFV